MPPPSDCDRTHDEAGFTLVELLVTMIVSVLILFAVLNTLDNFSYSAARQTRATDANEQLRATMDRVVSDLRQARSIEVADPNDFVYTVTDSATQTRRERICLDSSSRLWRSSVKTTSPPVVPIASGTACPTAGSGALQIANLLSANSASNRIFRYDSATAANVRSVGLTFALNAGDAHRSATSTLRASAFLRSQSERAPTVTDTDITTTCGSGSTGPLLKLAASVGSLTVAYTDINGSALGSGSAGASVQLPASAGGATVLANISNSLGVVTQIVKTLAC